MGLVSSAVDTWSKLSDQENQKKQLQMQQARDLADQIYKQHAMNLEDLKFNDPGARELQQSQIDLNKAHGDYWQSLPNREKIAQSNNDAKELIAARKATNYDFQRSGLPIGAAAALNGYTLTPEDLDAMAQAHISAGTLNPNKPVPQGQQDAQNLTSAKNITGPPIQAEQPMGPGIYGPPATGDASDQQLMRMMAGSKNAAPNSIPKTPEELRQEVKGLTAPSFELQKQKQAAIEKDREGKLAIAQQRADDYGLHIDDQWKQMQDRTLNEQTAQQNLKIHRMHMDAIAQKETASKATYRSGMLGIADRNAQTREDFLEIRKQADAQGRRTVAPWLKQAGPQIVQMDRTFRTEMGRLESQKAKAVDTLAKYKTSPTQYGASINTVQAEIAELDGKMATLRNSRPWQMLYGTPDERMNETDMAPGDGGLMGMVNYWMLKAGTPGGAQDVQSTTLGGKIIPSAKVTFGGGPGPAKVTPPSDIVGALINKYKKR